jgi:hypothetical protein
MAHTPGPGRFAAKPAAYPNESQISKKKNDNLQFNDDIRHPADCKSSAAVTLPAMRRIDMPVYRR